MFIAWIVFHVIVCISLILVVLMQSAKGEGLAGGTAFGGGVSGAVFGGRGAASFLSKATTVLAVVFMINCGALAFMSSSRQVIDDGSSGNVGKSAITRKATEERDAALQRQAQQQEAQQQNEVQQDTTQQDANEVPVEELQGETLPILMPPGDTSSSGN